MAREAAEIHDVGLARHRRAAHSGSCASKRRELAILLPPPVTCRCPAPRSTCLVASRVRVGAGFLVMGRSRDPSSIRPTSIARGRSIAGIGVDQHGRPSGRARRMAGITASVRPAIRRRSRTHLGFPARTLKVGIAVLAPASRVSPLGLGFCGDVAPHERTRRRARRRVSRRPYQPRPNGTGPRDASQHGPGSRYRFPRPHPSRA